MIQLIYLLCTVLLLCLPNDNNLPREPIDNKGTNLLIELKKETTSSQVSEKSKKDMSPMEALDLVKGEYAVNFEKVHNKDGEAQSYYYKLPEADYYLAYEGPGEKPQYYMIHLYEFVIDDPDLGMGHSVTYGWYTVDKTTGEIVDKIEY